MQYALTNVLIEYRHAGYEYGCAFLVSRERERVLLKGSIYRVSSLFMLSVRKESLHCKDEISTSAFIVDMHLQ